jgi:hypothetical protein
MDRHRPARWHTWAGCLLLATAIGAHGQPGGRDRGPIEVKVVDGNTVVPEERARTNAGEGALIWRLTTPGHRFVGEGIVFQDKGQHDCRIVANGRQVRCAKLRHQPGREFKYDVHVGTDGGRVLEPLDPWIVND